jgi:DNA-binding IclR family transcriptional regulator
MFRILVTLESHGFVKQDSTTSKYRLGVSCLELGSQFLKNNDIRKAALEALEKEFARVREQGFALVERMGKHIKRGLDQALQKAAAEISGEVGWGRGVDRVGMQNNPRAWLAKSKTRIRANAKRACTVR